MMNENLFSVSSLNRYIKQMFDNNFVLKGLRLKGEISNFKRYPSGHIYFSLKDEDSQIKAVMFADYTKFMPSTIKDGDEVIVIGSVNVYPQRGEYQIYVQAIELFGEGAQLLELELLKKKLAAEGLFDPSKKRKINPFPSVIGIISAPNSAALADMKTNLLRRNPLLEVKVFPSLVQGSEAPKELLEALKKAKNEKIDTLIIGRGGGSSEDLSAFNDEKLVREAAAFPVPIISAVGHEVDFTLIDYVADARASTPTGAAELATIDKREIYELLATKAIALDETINDKLNNYKHRLEILKSNVFFKNPKSMYEKSLIEIQNISKNLDNNLNHLLEIRKEKVESLSKRLSAISIDSTLQRGFAIMQDDKGNVVKSIKDIKINQLVKTRINGGSINAKVVSKEEN